MIRTKQVSENESISFLPLRTENQGQKALPVVKYVEKLNFIPETLVF